MNFTSLIHSLPWPELISLLLADSQDFSFILNQYIFFFLKNQFYLFLQLLTHSFSSVPMILISLPKYDYAHPLS